MPSNGVVSAQIRFWPVLGGVVLSDELALSELVEFRFSPADPYAVHILIPDGGHVWEWVVARDLLDAGRAAPAGEGDVRVYPATFNETTVVVLTFFSDGEYRPFGVSPQRLTEFLQRTFQVVAAGDEAALLDVHLDLVLGRSA